MTRLLQFAAFEISEFGEAFQDFILPLLGGLGMLERTEVSGCLHQARQKSGLGGVELGWVLGKEGGSGGVDTVGTVSEVDLVQVQLENLVFAKKLFHAASEDGFSQLSTEGLFIGKETVAGQLHGNGAGTLTETHGTQISEERSQHSSSIDTVVLVESTILDGDDRLFHRL